MPDKVAHLTKINNILQPRTTISLEKKHI